MQQLSVSYTSVVSTTCHMLTVIHETFEFVRLLTRFHQSFRRDVVTFNAEKCVVVGA